ncbi:hypothetical protein [Sphingomonas sp. Leaf62]|uniref:hypothetical protein n=1 Tax=Sphingomonas sp. Leaf62 TaxID=1736228 RepID=UPI0006F50386|nr:hypothetical protein [Sphingomonas sp. Leaf62]KQN77865.1 hypothetical protein ASE91_14190 [Sphingomonas sp. Leaf62]
MPLMPAISTTERERQRFEHLVLGRPRPKPGRNKARKGKVPPVVRLAPGIEEIVQLREDYSHKAQGTPETHHHHAVASRRVGSLARLVASGAIDAHQLAAAQDIAAAYEATVADVAVRIASYEVRGTGGGPLAASAEPIAAVIRERAYDSWRKAVGVHGQMLLAIIVDDMALTTAAQRWRMSNRRARGVLTTALDRWKRC